MNLIFPETTKKPPIRHFSLPSDLQIEEKSQGESSFTVTPTPILNSSLVSSIQERIEYGIGNIGFREHESETVKDLSNHHTQRLASLHSARQILCHIAAIDKSGYFISSSPIVQIDQEKKNNNSSKSKKSNYFFSLTDIYTTIHALKLEYENLLQLQHIGNGKNQLNKESLALYISETEIKIDNCIKLLESTILQMILNFNRSREIPTDYIINILRNLPRFFAIENWPCMILQKDENKRIPQKRSRNNDNENIITDDNDFYDRVGNATTAIVMKTLLEIKNNDCLRILNNSIKKLSLNNTRSSIVDFSSFITFEEIMNRTSNGIYGRRGLYGALYDMKIFFYGIYSSIQPEQDINVTSIRLQFEETIRRYYSEFLQKAGILDLKVKNLLNEETIFDINPIPIDNYKDDKSSIYTETQIKSLKILDLLRLVDTKKWFENPVFDMANIELSSIERWIRSKTFGVKTNREAFIALRDVLEQMAEKCVLSYGPSSPFTQVITAVRQHLVIAAREVGLQ